MATVCGKRVYGAERADADGQTYHKYVTTGPRLFDKKNESGDAKERNGRGLTRFCFFRACMRCAECQCIVKLGSYAVRSANWLHM
jgi:hypothetical protein